MGWPLLLVSPTVVPATHAVGLQPVGGGAAAPAASGAAHATNVPAIVSDSATRRRTPSISHPLNAAQPSDPLRSNSSDPRARPSVTQRSRSPRGSRDRPLAHSVVDLLDHVQVAVRTERQAL